MCDFLLLRERSVMKEKNRIGRILILIFIAATGILFFCDFEEDTPSVVPAETMEESLSEPEESSSVSQAASACAEETSADAGTLYVYVCGQVKNPDVYTLPNGSRVFEALEAAGGVTKKAQPDSLNLAGLLSDGDKIYVPAEGENTASAGSASGGSGSTGSASGSGSQSLVNINKASAEELQSLPGIGESKAADIISYREANGPFKSKEDLMKIPGIKEGVYKKVEALITVQ